MNIDELTKRLEALQATVPASTIRRWAKDELITPPNKRHRSKGEGRGTISEWSERSLEEIAGCYCIKNFGSYRRDFTDSVERAKNLADRFYADPVGFVSFVWPRSYRNYYVRDDFDELHKDYGHSLYVYDRRDFFEYVGGMEKAKFGFSVSDRMYIDFLFIFDRDSRNGALRYSFGGVGFTPIKEPIQTEVRVRTFSHEDFLKLKERSEIKIRGQNEAKKMGRKHD